MFASSHDSLHKALKSIMTVGEYGILTWVSSTSEGNMDIRMSSKGRIEYVTMPFSKFSRIVDSSPTSLVVRIFDKVLEGNVLPTKRIYSFFMKDDGSVHKLSPEACAEQHCVDFVTGERLQPEPLCLYL